MNKLRKEKDNSQKALPGYRIFPVAWQLVSAKGFDASPCDSESSLPAIWVNLEGEVIHFSKPANDQGKKKREFPAFSIPPLHFSVLRHHPHQLKINGTGKLLVVTLDSVPAFPEYPDDSINVFPVPTVALSLLENLLEENSEVPLPLTVRALIELLTPSLCDEFEKDETIKFRNYISQHLSEHISIEDIAAALGMSTVRLRELTRETIGMTPAAYLREERNRLARDLLATTSIRIEQIAERTGYSDRFSFTRAFTAATGLSPNAYRESAVINKR
ncbi:MAG: AraC family transcriptional regulator [Verrucomicrobiales bacterium]|nr:AraC family transcriptional regulator [Verrucomicrobiales bacterium]